MPEKNEIISNHPVHETSTVWKEAGFIPPSFCRTIVEFLHRLNSDDIENIYDTDIIPNLIRGIDKKSISGCSVYYFTDLERMYSFAEDMDIPAGKMNDVEIAGEILYRLINEYIDDNPDFKKKSGILKILSGISTCIA
ncbi:MAG: hypothetical protein JW931_06260 [Methanomicrobiaceae archaeon]|nr:hypothetical protein [Methanomicrobiaceae archaeon]